MRFTRICIVGLVMWGAVGAPGTAAEEPKPQARDSLPEPLSRVFTNFANLASTGYFEVGKMAFGRTKKLDEEALLWNIKVTKPLTCQHAIGLLRNMSDGRFYRTLKKSRLELHAAQLLYPSWIDFGAVNHQILGQDQEFQVWILLNAAEVTNLRLREVDTLEFRPVRHARGGAAP